MERKNLESAAANYSYLRGLLAVPVGLAIVVAAVTNAWGPLRWAWLFIAAWIVLGAAWLLVRRYYNEHYGRVVHSTKMQMRSGVATAVGVVVLFVGEHTDTSFHLPVNGTAVALAIVALAFYGTTVGLRRHHVAIWGGLLLAGLVPAWGDVGEEHKIGVGLLLIGVATIATGVFDHLAFTRMYGPPADVTLENSNAGA
jgi:putative effector of murein hydrolase LrgA (UPF0299 family)